MTREKLGGISLITGAVALILLAFSGPMGFHLSLDEQGRRLLTLMASVLSGPFLLLIFFGLFAFARRVAARTATAELGLVLQGAATVLGLIAVAVSCVVETQLAAHLDTTQGTEREMLDAILHATELQTDTLRIWFVALSAVATLVWSAVLLRSGTGSRAAGVVGLLAASLLLAVLVIGHLGVHVHVEDLAPVALGVWYIQVGRRLAGGSSGSA